MGSMVYSLFGVMQDLYHRPFVHPLTMPAATENAEADHPDALEPGSSEPLLTLNPKPLKLKS